MLRHVASKNSSILDFFYYVYIQGRTKCVMTIIVLFFPIITQLHIYEDDTRESKTWIQTF